MESYCDVFEFGVNIGNYSVGGWVDWVFCSLCSLVVGSYRGFW